MTELRSTEQRKADVLATLGRNADLWVATASSAGEPHLIAASSWWDGERVVIATTAASQTARNLDATGKARLAIGSPDDVVMADVQVEASVAVAGADEALSNGFAAAVGWNPAEVGPGWRYYRLLPLSIQAYRGYDELPGRQVMRGSRWL